MADVDADAAFPFTPWHLWGNSETVRTIVQATLNPASPLRPATQQLTKVEYGRPDSWRFLFGVQVIAAPDAAVGDDIVIQVDFDVIAGLGRSQLSMPAAFQGVPQPAGFMQFVFDYTGIINGQIKWSSVTRAPQTNELAGLGFRPELDVIVAQDIQTSARVIAVGDPAGANIGLPVVVTVHSYFAPNVHIRPEWVMGEFNGREDKGK